MMDEMDGYEFMDILSKKDEYKDVSFVFLTAKSGLDEKMEGLSKGAADYIFKPFVMEEVILRVYSIIKNYELRNTFFKNEKYIAIGKLVANVTHEIANPLFGIKGPLEYIKTKINSHFIDSEQNLTRAFEYISINVKRIENIIKNLKLLYQNKDLSKKDIIFYEFIVPILDALKIEYPNVVFQIDSAKDFKIYLNEISLKIIVENILIFCLEDREENRKIGVSANEKEGRVNISIRGEVSENLENKFISTLIPFFETNETKNEASLSLHIIKEFLLKNKMDLTATLEENIPKRFKVLIETL